MSWSVFHVIECMSSHKSAEKKVGYMAATLSFNQETPVLMLCTNLTKKDMFSNTAADSAMALHTLAHIVNVDLARDLHQDVMVMLSHSNPYIGR